MSPSGPLRGIRVLELGGIGPAPFCGMVLSDLGAEVVRCVRPGSAPSRSPLDRGRETVEVDLKDPAGVDLALRFAALADVAIEGFRPGVAERLGVGPDDCRSRNPRLVYGRMTGYGQSGPLAAAPGHDINYLALAGVLAHVGRPDSPPVPPLNLVADFGGGGMLLAVGVLAALLERSVSGEGQAVDAAMVDGSALLMAMTHGMWASGSWLPERGANILDGGAPFYDSYETADGRHVAVGANEAPFYDAFLTALGLDDVDRGEQFDRDRWPALKARVAEVFRTRTRDEWAERFAGLETCFAPVLTIDEARAHPHNAERGTFVDVDGVVQAAPAPRFSRTPGELSPRPVRPPAAILRDWTDAVARAATGGTSRPKEGA